MAACSRDEPCPYVSPPTTKPPPFARARAANAGSCRLKTKAARAGTLGRKRSAWGRAGGMSAGGGHDAAPVAGEPGRLEEGRRRAELARVGDGAADGRNGRHLGAAQVDLVVVQAAAAGAAAGGA